MSILILEVYERLGEVVDCGVSVALVDGVDELASDGGVVGAYALEVGHAVGSVLFDDLLVVHALSGRAHRVSDESSHEAPVDLVGKSVCRHLILLHSRCQRDGMGLCYCVS